MHSRLHGRATVEIHGGLGQAEVVAKQQSHLMQLSFFKQASVNVGPLLTQILRLTMREPHFSPRLCKLALCKTYGHTEQACQCWQAAWAISSW